MKTFVNAIRFALVALLFVSVTALGLGNCCQTKCQTRSRCETGCTTAPACRLKPQQVEIVKTCDHPGYYKQVCRLEYEPCEGKVTTIKACPIYKGCFAEDGSPMNEGQVFANDDAVVTNNVQVEVKSPAYDKSYSRTKQSKNARVHRNNGRNMHKNTNANNALVAKDSFSEDMPVAD